jgi:hypothetical protein
LLILCHVVVLDRAGNVKRQRPVLAAEIHSSRELLDPYRRKVRARVRMAEEGAKQSWQQ